MALAQTWQAQHALHPAQVCLFFGTKEGNAVSTASDLPSLCFVHSNAVTGCSQSALQPMISTPAQSAHAQL